MRTAATLVGGALVGIGGAAYSLDFKAGWSHRHTAGYGWIALAIVICGGFHPVRAALGAYLCGVLSSLASLGPSAAMMSVAAGRRETMRKARRG